MIKLKEIFSVSFMALSICSVAHADIASTGYVNQQVATKQDVGDYVTNGELATVATTGSYNDLTNKPSIPSAYTLPAATSSALGGVKSGGDIEIGTDGTVTVNSANSADSATKATQDGNGNTISSTYTKIAQGSGNANKAVITNASGNITTGTITSAMITDGTITNADISSSAAIDASKISGLKTVATTGSYNDLTDKPSIPSAYTLPAATSSALGGVKSGGNISVATDGTVTVNSATKATRDASGNVITTTYATKSQITDLDSTSSGSGAVVTEVAQVDGKVTVTKGNVQIPVGSATATTYATIWVE